MVHIVTFKVSGYVLNHNIPNRQKITPYLPINSYNVGQIIEFCNARKHSDASHSPRH